MSRNETRRGSDGRVVGRAAGVAQFRPRLRRRAGSARLQASPGSTSTATSPRSLARIEARRRLQRAARARSARTARSRACSRSCASPTPIRACSPRRWRCRRTSPRSCCARRACRSRTAWSSIATRRPAATCCAPPYVLKPVNEGSSFGVVIVKEDRAHPPQEVGREDWPYGDRLLAERFVAGKELTCAVMGDRALDIIEIQPVSEAFYGYDAKYAKGGSVHVLPAKIKPKIYHKVQDLALRAHRALGCRGVSRADFRFDETKGDDGRTGVSRGQHPAGHDRNFAGAGNGGPRGPVVRRTGGVDGGGRVLRSLSEARPSAARPSRRSRAPPRPPRAAQRAAARRARGARRVPPRACRSTGRRRSGVGLALDARCCSSAPPARRGARRTISRHSSPREGGVGDFVARALGFGVTSVTIPANRSMSEPRGPGDRRRQRQEFAAVLRRRRGARAARGRAARQAGERAQALSRPDRHRHRRAHARRALAEGRRDQARSPPTAR